MSVETRQSTILPRPRRRVVWLLALGSIGLAVVIASALLFIVQSPSGSPAPPGPQAMLPVDAGAGDGAPRR